MALKDFIQGFCASALWTGTYYETQDQADSGQGVPLDNYFSVCDIPTDVMEEITQDCESFYDNHAHLWDGDRINGYDDECAGHDFNLSRNGHGAGFWDRGLENGDDLHEATKPYGSFGLEGFCEDGEDKLYHTN